MNTFFLSMLGAAIGSVIGLFAVFKTMDRD